MEKGADLTSTDSEIEAIADSYRCYFSDRFKKSGDDVKTLWGSSESQRIRFKVLSEIADLNAKSLLDVGSGFGDFLNYLSDQTIELKDYLGLEITPSIIEVARNRHPNAKFEQIDILKQPLGRRFDYAVASGILFLRCEGWQEYFLSILERLRDATEIGFAFNLLSIHSKNRESDSYYCDPGETLNLVMQRICKRSVLRHDYRENDFTIYCYK